MLRIGISRQQYQRLESKGNPRLDTLELVAKGLKSELLLIPEEKLDAVLALLAEEADYSAAENDSPKSSISENADTQKLLSNDPWQGLLGDEE